MRLASRTTVFIVALAVFGALATRFLDHTVDDAFISFRYAENLAAGHGLLFNPGREPVEGYTNFLWVLLLAPFIGLGFDPEPVARVMGLAASVGTLSGVVRLSPAPPEGPEVRWVAPLLLATSPPLAVWATGGLETPLFACFVVWSVALAARDLERGTLGPGSALCLAGAALTRPEGAALAAVVGGLLLVLSRGTGSSRERLRWALVFLGVFVPYFIWRWSYYGDPLPNTFYAKVGSDPSQVMRGLRYVHGFFVESGYWLLVPCAGLVWADSRRTVALLSGVVLSYTAYVLVVGGDGLPMYRFLVPVLPLFYVLVAWGVAGAMARFAPGTTGRVVAGILVAALCARAALPAFLGPSTRYVDQDRREVASWKQIGRWLATHLPPGSSIAVLPAGAVPFYSKLETIDMLGLNDRTIAHRAMPLLGRGQAGHEKHDAEYVLSREPTAILIGVYGLAPSPLPAAQLVRPYYAAETELLRSREFNSRYELRRGRTESGYFAYYRRR